MRAPRVLNDLFLPENLAILNWQNFRPGVEVAWTYMEGIAASHPSFAIKPVARYLGIGIRHANISSYWREPV